MNTRHVLIVVGAFLLSFAAGAVSMYAARDFGARHASSTALPQPFDELALDSAQSAQITAIFDAYQPRTDAILSDLIPRLAAIADSMDAEIHAILVPEQSQKLRRLQRPPTYLIKRRSSGGVRVDTLRPPQ